MALPHHSHSPHTTTAQRVRTCVPTRSEMRRETTKTLFDSLLDDMGEPTTGGDPVDVVGDLARAEGDNASDSNAANIPDPQDP